jgi:putative restriction endonuclease
MAVWWVNQNATFSQEVGGGYMWSPKRNTNGAFNQFYENMRRVEPGDLVLSFRNTRIAACGVILSNGYEAPKPAEFGSAGASWSDSGWRVDTRFTKIPPDHQIRPKDHIDSLRPMLPEKYSPLDSRGNGLQSVYLAYLPPDLASALLSLVGTPAQVAQRDADALDLDTAASEAADRIVDVIESSDLSSTEKESLVRARTGQGLYRIQLLQVEPCCRITGIDTPALLNASHIKPWARCNTNQERLDPFNGLMLTPTMDRLFDRGYMTFSDGGRVQLSSDLVESDARVLGVYAGMDVGTFNPRQLDYLAYHRDQVFRV